MGQGQSCRSSSHEQEFFKAVKTGDLETVESFLRKESSVPQRTTRFNRQSPLHIAAANGRLEVCSFASSIKWVLVLSVFLDRSLHPDVLNRHKKTPLMLAAMNGRIACMQKLLQAGANMLIFDSPHARTCLHYAAYYGHSDCLQLMLVAARSNQIADSWGFSRFVNIRDGSGATPLHLAAKQGQPECVHILLDNGALACALTDKFSYQGSSPLHLAARKGCLDSIRNLLAWGADRKQKDSSGRLPYDVALQRNHGACATLLNPLSPEPLVWPSPLKCISELNLEAKTLLERALMAANREREKNILKGTKYSLPSPVHSDAGIGDDVSEASDTELCCICFDQVCTIEVRDCGHQMCAHCTLALCCHKKPNPVNLCSPVPICPFCRCNIAGLAVAKSKSEGQDKGYLKARKSSKFQNFSEASSSFKSLSSAMSSLGKISSRGKLKLGHSCDKP
ncbi:E3 ubiquitin-protein ligase XB3-like isoform X1 [Typha angustifolia]|uniref:E3 ubiquitin-protein ligase XB3-like isoform X1 n=1 Tax=Typha angustifolia TaxID=59011 RepID=UPI003C2F1234